VKNPVREHGASSMEKALYLWGLIANGRRWSANGRRWSANGRRWSANGRRWSANGRRWSAPKPTWPFIPARKSGAFWLFHVRPAPPQPRGLKISFHHAEQEGFWARRILDTKAQFPYLPSHWRRGLIISPAVNLSGGDSNLCLPMNRWKAW
jgi:hypothetical protein